MSIKLKIETMYDISDEDAMMIVWKMICNHPDLVKRMTQVREEGHRVSCPFPFRCKEFPCEKMRCSANVLSNGKDAHKIG